MRTKKTTGLVVFLLMFVMVPALSSAAIRVTISDGTNTRNSTNQPPGFDLSSDVTTTGTVTLNILSCSTPPCTGFFPTGTAATSTFRFEDISASSRARIIKTDSSTDRLELKGVKITSLTAGKTLTFTFETETPNATDNDFATITSTSGSYPFSVALVGSFKTSGGTLATACPNPATLTTAQLQTSCVKLLLQVNGITANGSGPSGIATASLPCKNGTGTPCATSGGSYSSTGSFSSTDSSSISCGTTCRPRQKAILIAKFNGTNETLTSANSGVGALSTKDEADFGFELLAVDLANDLANELGGQWVPPYNAGNELFKGVPRPPMGKTTRASSDFLFPIKFGLKSGQLVPASVTSGLKLLSIVDDPELLTLSATDQARYLRSYASFTPIQPQKVLDEDSEVTGVTGGVKLQDLTTLQYNFNVLTGNVPSGDPRLGNVNLSDCTNGSIRVKIELLKPFNSDDPDSALDSAGPVYVYLGNDSLDDFRSDCDPNEVTGELVANGQNRVDASNLDADSPPSCCTTFTDVKDMFGDFFVRSISFVVDKGTCDECSLPVANYGVDFISGEVSYQIPCGELCTPTIKSFTLAPGSTAFPLFATGNFVDIKAADFPTDGVKVQIYKFIGSVPTLVFETTNVTIEDNQYKAIVNTADLQRNSGQTDYRADLCLFGGRCIADSGFFGLK